MSSASSDITALGGGAAQGFAYGGPVGAAIGALAAIPTLFQTSVTGIEKQDATTVVNAAAPIFNENKTLFLKNPTPATQQAAIANFMQMWESMTSKLISFGHVGTVSVNDRAPGGKVDWWALYLDPIQNYQFPAIETPYNHAANVSFSSPAQALSGAIAGAVAASAIARAMPFLVIIAVATFLLVIYG